MYTARHWALPAAGAAAAAAEQNCTKLHTDTAAQRCLIIRLLPHKEARGAQRYWPDQLMLRCKGRTPWHQWQIYACSMHCPALLKPRLVCFQS